MYWTTHTQIHARAREKMCNNEIQHKTGVLFIEIRIWERWNWKGFSYLNIQSLYAYCEQRGRKKRILLIFYYVPDSNDWKEASKSWNINFQQSIIFPFHTYTRLRVRNIVPENQPVPMLDYIQTNILICIVSDIRMHSLVLIHTFYLRKQTQWIFFFFLVTNSVFPVFFEWIQHKWRI